MTAEGRGVALPAAPHSRLPGTGLRAAGLLTAGLLAAPVLGPAAATAATQEAEPMGACPTPRPILLTGIVHDAVNRDPVAGAEVRATQGGATPMFWTARSGPDGGYRLCVPAGEDTLRLRASVGERVGPAVALIPSGDRVVHLEVPLTEAQDLVGTVVDAMTERAVARAVVTLEPLGVSTFSDEAGRFVFAELPEGEYDITAESTGYRPFEGRVLLRDLGQGAERVRVPLEPEAFELEELVVEVDRRPYLEDVGFYERRAGGRGGLFLTEEHLEQPVWRAATLDQVATTSWDARRRILGKCVVVWLDGRIRGWSDTMGGDAAESDGFTIDVPITARAALSWVQSGEAVGMEVLAPGEVPLRYQYVPPGLTLSFDATRCGAILVWTEVGAERARRR